MRTIFLKWLIESAVPFLNRFRNPPKWPFTLHDHRNMFNGTLGHDVSLFLDQKDLPLLPKYEVHDTIHVLTGYGTTPIDELKLQAFMVGNRSSTFPGKILLAIGFLLAPDHYRELQSEMKRGRTALRIADYNFETLVYENTHDLRCRMKIIS